MQNPLSIPGGWNKDTPAEERSNPVDAQSVPRSPAAGVVSETGDVLDEAGKNIGKLAESQDPKELVGNTVTTAGDVISSTGEIVGKAVPADDEHSEYTTATPEKQKKSSGFGLSGLKSVYNTVDGTFRPVTSRLGLGSKSGASDVERSQSEATEKQPLEQQERGSEIKLQEHDQSHTGKDTEFDDNDDFQELPPEPQDEAEIDVDRMDTVKPEDSISKIDDDTSKDEQNNTPPTEPTEVGRPVPEDSIVSGSGVPPSDVQSGVKSQAKSGAPESEVLTDARKSEVSGSKTGEGSEFVTAELEPQESIKSGAPETEPGTEAPKSEIPKSEVSKTEVTKSDIPESKAPESQIPLSEAPPSEAPLSEAPPSEVPPSQIPPSEAPGTHVSGSKAPETEALKSAVPGSEAGSKIPGSEVEGTEVEGNEAAGTEAAGTEAAGTEAAGTEAAGTEVPGTIAGTGVPGSEVPGSEIPGSEVPETNAPEEEGKKLDYAALQGCRVNKGGNLVNDKGEIVGHIIEGDLKMLLGKLADENGDIWSEGGKILGKGEPLPDNEREDLKDFAPFENFPGAIVEADGRVLFEGKQVGQVIEGDPKRLKGSKVDEDGDILDRRGNVIGKAEAWDEPEEEAEPEIDYSVLAGKRVNKAGNVVDSNGVVFGRVIEGHIGSVVGRTCDKNGNILSESGEVLGRAELVTETQHEDGPFAELDGCTVAKDGIVVTSSGDIVGRLVSGDPKVLFGRSVDDDGDILDRNGNVIGTAERWEPEEEPEPEIDYSILAGKRVNKAGNVVDSNGVIFGRVIEGHIGSVIGRMCDKNGNILSESGEVIGRAELVPESQREGVKDGPFAELDGCTVAKDGTVVTASGDIVGRLVSGDPKVLFGRSVDDDGDILDRNGNVIGTAERWEPEEAEPEPEIDYSILGGKRVNKAGNVVDSSGVIYGRVVEGHIGSVIGRMCDKDGNIRSESGEVIGRAELVPEGQREGVKDGPFAEMVGCTVAKDGTVVTASGDIVGRLTSGDPKVLYGRAVDEDGDVLDRNGNVIGKAERWEPEVVEKKKDFLAGRRVNREGNVVDDDGNIIGKLTSGDILVCSGKEVDEDGDVVNQKGQTIGHVTRLEDIPPEPEPEPEPEVETETEEEKQKRLEAEKDRKLAGQLAYCVEQALDKIRPICKLITDKIDRAERTPKEELDEEELVKQVKPLIEEGGKILTETNGVIRGLDPDGRIQRNAKHRSATREGTPEEFHLAEVLKELAGTVTQCIENAKRKIEDMPHAKEELNPLWGLLAEPLFQILAAVGLLLSGVLGLVGKLLSGLGLGGLVDSLLGGLGVDKILESLGLGSVIGSLTGKNKKKK